MKFTPQSEDELYAEAEKAKEKFAPWPADTVCDYDILHVKDIKKDGSPAIDKNGNEFLIADIRIFNDAGEQRDLTHNLGAWNKWHLKRICDANNMEDRYLSGQIDTYDLQGKTGKCIIGIEKGQPKGDGTFYNDKNVIKEFLKPSAPIGKTSTTKQTEYELNDEIPF
jgi:hypothetical protein